ncbi:MAG: Ig-like domain-containing protein [Terracidiphilus sp.]
MFDRVKLGALLLIGVALPIMGCGSAEVDTLQVSPATVSMVPGATAQLTATGVYSHGSGPSTTQDLTNQVTWSTASADVATVSNTGLVTGVGAGTVSITASIKGYTGVLSATSAITVTSTTTGTAGGDIVSLSIIPGSQTVAGPNNTATFLAVGTTASGATVNVDSQVVWSSSSSQIATVGSSTGIATSVGQGTATITGVYTNADGTVATGTATITVTAGANSDFTALTILPGSQTISSGGSSDFIALATAGASGLIENVSDNPSLKWSSTIPAIATISSTGIATGVSTGTATIAALLTNPDNSVASATANLTVSATPPPEPILSLTIIPGSITVGDFYLTGQFLAIGTFATAPYVRDLTNDPATTWLSSQQEIFPVDTNSGGNPGASAGLVTAIGSGGATIIAESASQDGTIQTATATFSCPYLLPAPPQPGSCYPGEPPAYELLATLTVYNEGLNTTNWLVTAPSATGTPDVIHCGPAWVPTAKQPGTGSVCTATYPMNVTTPAGTQGVVITATGGQFGGWSYNCIPSDANGKTTNPPAQTAAGPNYCVIPFTGTYTYVDSGGNTHTVTVNGLNQTVGAIFN